MGQPHFTAHEGRSTILTGVESELALSWVSEDSLRDHRIVMWVESGQTPGEEQPILGPSNYGFLLAPVSSSDNPLRVSLEVSAKVATGRYRLRVALADADSAPNELVIGDVFDVPLQVIRAGTGDVQIALSWDAVADLDLHVFPPGGSEIYFANTRDPSGGQLDLDSFGRCDLENDRGHGNENVFWPDGQAPTGTYRVEAHLFDPCESFSTTIAYRVAVVLDRSELLVAEGDLDPLGATRVQEALSFDY